LRPRERSEADLGSRVPTRPRRAPLADRRLNSERQEASWPVHTVDVACPARSPRIGGRVPSGPPARGVHSAGPGDGRAALARELLANPVAPVLPSGAGKALGKAANAELDSLAELLEETDLRAFVARPPGTRGPVTLQAHVAERSRAQDRPKCSQ
jgi:hypothetical protein